MKTKNFIPLLIAGSLCLTSCDQVPTETAFDSVRETTASSTQMTETTRDPNATTYPPATVPIFSTQTDIPMTPTEYEDTFESFMLSNINKQKEWMYFGEKGTYSPDGRWFGTPQLIIYRVVGRGGYVNVIGHDNPHMDYTIYYMQIEYVYGFDEYDTEKIYEMHYPGHLDRQVYAFPPLEVGTLMASMTIFDNPESLKQPKFCSAKYIMAEKKGDIYYLYGTWQDFSNMECKIAITDSEENSVYKSGKHDKAIAYLESVGQPLPTFDYKCEAEAFYNESVWRSKNNPFKSSN